MAMIKIKNLTKKYGDKAVYDNFNLEIKKNKILVILGESGSGKTTLLNVLANLTEYEGQIEGLDGAVSMLFQKDYLVPNLTVEQNLKLVCKNKDVLSALESVEMQDYAKYYPKSLSAGMARRIAIIRALLYGANLIVMDEPTNSLDVGLKAKIYTMLKQLKKECEKTIVIVTHDIDEALWLADRVILIKDGKIDYSYSFKSSIYSRDITDEESNLVRKELLDRLL